MVSHPCTKFDANPCWELFRFCDSRSKYIVDTYLVYVLYDIVYNFDLLTDLAHNTKYKFIYSSWYITWVKYDENPPRGSWDIVFHHIHQQDGRTDGRINPND